MTTFIEINKIASFLTKHGSHAYGLNGPTSDLDLRGFFFLTPEQFFGLHEQPQQYDCNENKIDAVVWEYRKFVRLAAQCNPNVVECLFTDPSDIQVNRGYEYSSLRFIAHDFLSKKAEMSFGGYARQQFLKLAKNFDKWEDPRVRKDAMHCARLIFFAKEILETGTLTVRVSPEKRAFLMDIRNGTSKAIATYLWAEKQFEELKVVAANSTLPTEPNWDKINAHVQTTLMEFYNGKD